MTANKSPATPTIIGSTTESTAAVATAASTAFPPCRRICRPASAASGWLVATIPCCAMTSDRVCAGQPSARTPRTALQNDAGGTVAQEGSTGGAGAAAAAPPSARAMRIARTAVMGSPPDLRGHRRRGFARHGLRGLQLLEHLADRGIELRIAVLVHRQRIERHLDV